MLCEWVCASETSLGGWVARLRVWQRRLTQGGVVQSMQAARMPASAPGLRMSGISSSSKLHGGATFTSPPRRALDQLWFGRSCAQRASGEPLKLRHGGASVFIGTSSGLGIANASYTVELSLQLSVYNMAGPRMNCVVSARAANPPHAAPFAIWLHEGCPTARHGTHTVSCGLPLSLHERCHVAVVYDKPCRRLTVFVDGSEVASESPVPPMEARLPLHIGSNQGKDDMHALQP